MTSRVPELSNDDVERFLHEWMRKIVEAQATEPEGQKAMKIAMAGAYGALMNLERSRQPGSEPPQSHD